MTHVSMLRIDFPVESPHLFAAEMVLSKVEDDPVPTNGIEWTFHGPFFNEPQFSGRCFVNTFVGRWLPS